MDKEKIKRLIKNIEDMCIEGGRAINPEPIDLGLIETWAHQALQELEKAVEHGQ